MDLQRQVAEARLDPERAVKLKKVKLGAGPGTLFLDDGILIPATTVGGRTLEMVFLGSARIEMKPPDEIEAEQLELFTGAPILEEKVNEIVLVLGMDTAVQALLQRPKAALDATQAQRSAEIWKAWREAPERNLLDAAAGILSSALGDPAAQGTFVASFRGQELGNFLYVVHPEAREQVTVGRVVPLRGDDLIEELMRQDTLDLKSLVRWQTWVSASLRGQDGTPAPGQSSFEPQRYTLELAVAEDLRVSGVARIELKPMIRGARFVRLRLAAGLAVSKVTDGSGRELSFFPTREGLSVRLPGPVADGEIAEIAVEYGGDLIKQDEKSYALSAPLSWYPRAGTIDRALYDVTFRWPKKLDLVAAGGRFDGGEAQGVRWERRRLDPPSDGFSFEVGHYRIETMHAGHVQISLAFDPEVDRMGKETREEIAKAVVGAVGYFENLFGPYPLKELTVVTSPRSFSQAPALGLVTLSSNMMFDSEVSALLYGRAADRRLVVAHEIAHQWWGHVVGWESYRDQWISEAMATHAALRYAGEVLKNELSGLDFTSGWQTDLTTMTPLGRTIGDLGPVVLGDRLRSSLSRGVYQVMVYKKGAVIFEMLARALGEERFTNALRQIIEVSSGKSISTENLLALLEHITSTDLQGFAGQFIYGTALPEVLYSYAFEKNGRGWIVRGQVHQQTPYRYTYEIGRTERGTFDVIRKASEQIDIQHSMLVAPVEIAIYDPSGGKGRGPGGANATVAGNLLLKGESTALAIEVEQEPKGFWLDRRAKVFGLFLDESRNPKRALFYQGLKAASAGRLNEAEGFYDKALATQEPPPEADTGETVYWKDIKRARQVLNGRIEIARARLLMDRGRDEEAEAAIARARRSSPDGEGSLDLLQARLDVRLGRYEKAFKSLRGMLERGGGVLGSGEGYALLAIAAQATGRKTEYESFVRRARRSGVDASILTAAGSSAP